MPASSGLASAQVDWQCGLRFSYCWLLLLLLLLLLVALVAGSDLEKFCIRQFRQSGREDDSRSQSSAVTPADFLNIHLFCI